MTALNSLFKEVSKQNRMLVDINKTLEQKVKERTDELYQANKHLEKMALTDQLTGLPNRRHAMYYLDDYWNKSQSEVKVISCVMIDADGFKQINDQYGHDAGDIVLKVLSSELKNSFRTDDLVARLGGDEFLALAILYDTPLQGAAHISEQVRKKVSQLNVKANDGLWHGSISVGVASSTDDMVTFNELLKHADLAVYKAKNSGKNCVKIYEES